MKNSAFTDVVKSKRAKYTEEEEEKDRFLSITESFGSKEDDRALRDRIKSLSPKSRRKELNKVY